MYDHELRQRITDLLQYFPTKTQALITDEVEENFKNNSGLKDLYESLMDDVWGNAGVKGY